MPTFYRIVRTDPPTLYDVLSLAAQGRTPAKLTPREQRMAERISVYDRASAAADMARQLRGKRGWFLVELDIPEDGPFTYELTGRNGHFTVWGDPLEILGTVRLVIPIPHWE